MRQNSQFASNSVTEGARRLGERLRRARKAQKLSLSDLERICRIHRTTLGRLERGDLGASIGVLLSVLEALNELADVELVLSQPDTPEHRRVINVPVLDQDF
ncbi:helix-turn-helix transcriptional regulator [Undibacterium seohonense]|uniref:Helix-turn-helix transcriptional regulator n=1 Tax=Undibacterium seohonense TaxID=1344950 RepID=A0ABR6X8Q3_9BURK|nr:helix-turn-helix transcriptional regulator [Undibacterium seohonense]MBC3809216.1 helix-turn-helix transcriptional regulator [Undibacterium seohonense]